MSLFDVLWNVSQESRISRAGAQAHEAASGIGRVRDENQDLQRKVETLSLACQALWELVREREGLDDSVLLRKIEEIDLRDGRRDGKIAGGSVTCPACGKSNRSTRRQCLYCGTSVASPHIFEQE